jgi:hypothetical protein
LPLGTVTILCIDLGTDMVCILLKIDYIFIWQLTACDYKLGTGHFTGLRRGWIWHYEKAPT